MEGAVAFVMLVLCFYMRAYLFAVTAELTQFVLYQRSYLSLFCIGDLPDHDLDLFSRVSSLDHPRDQAGKYLYYAGTFLAVSSKPLQIAQRDFSGRFMCV